VRAKTIAAVLASAAIVVLWLPGGALARGQVVQIVGSTGKRPTRRGGKPRVAQEMHLNGTNGFKVTIKLDDRRHLTLVAKDEDFKRRSLRFVAYGERAPQRLGSADINARLGSLGRIDVRFVRTKTVRPHEGPKCAIAGLRTEVGHYVGAISFRGDDGFTRVQAHSAPGSVEREAPQSCHFPKAVEHDPKTEREEAETVGKLEEEEQAQKAEEEHHVQLIATLDGGKVAFSAQREEVAGAKGKVTTTNFVAFGLRQRGRLRESAIDLIFLGGGSSFQLTDPSNPTAGATVTPPAPFSGSATFLQESGQPPTWTGDLRVDLPGFGTVPLTGPGVKASTCAASGCAPGGSFSQSVAPEDRALR
jgi:hypothetical protein